MARYLLQVAAVAIVVLGASAEARADVGIPMLVLAWPAYILALIPVVLIEAFVGVRQLRLPWPDALRATAIANLWSTFLGIPVVWLLLLALEFFVGGIASLLDLSSRREYVLFPFMIAWVGGEDVWVIYFAFVLLAVPFCVVSIWIERKVALRQLPAVPATSVRAWVRDANIWSYAFLVLVAIIYPLALSGHAT